MENRAKPSAFLEIDEKYLQFIWTHPASNVICTAIFRDVTNDGKFNVSLDQPIRGEWSVYDKEQGKVINDPSKAPEAFRDVSEAAMATFADLNFNGLEAVRQKWRDAGTMVIDK